jgi:hypothetical protein
MDISRQSNRYEIVQRREFTLWVIPFKSLECASLIAHVVDLSKFGAGIESDQSLKPGFVWFKDRIGGFKAGLLVWGRQKDGKYRAGVKFVPLSRDREQLVQEQILAMRPNHPIHNPEVIISTILESMTRGETMSQGTPDRRDPEDLKALRSAEETPSEEDLIAQLRAMLSSL